MNPAPLTRDLELHLDAHRASPVFARLAERLLRNGEITRAISLCERGLIHFPDYSTAHLIQARCLAALNDHQAALRSLDRVIRAYPGNVILREMEADWKGPAGTGPVSPSTTGEAIAPIVEESGPPDDTPAPPVPGAPGITPSVIPAGIVGQMPAETGRTPFSPGNDKSLTGFIVENKIVSRTLAEIYASQGAIGEAVATYRLLVAGVPDKREMYEERLKELEERLRSDPGIGYHPDERHP